MSFAPAALFVFEPNLVVPSWHAYSTRRSSAPRLLEMMAPVVLEEQHHCELGSDSPPTMESPDHQNEASTLKHLVLYMLYI
jgi:hypothetical protein